jgi:pimeloyl-ACP methyl ester carboxylesterase
MRCVMHVSNIAWLALPLAFASQQPGVSPGLPAAPGRLVDIGGQRLHLNCTGRGSPTVVFENGAGDFSVVWSFVQPPVSGLTRACSYDRAGYAWSDPGNRPRTYDQIALELHTALERAGERGPFVLVGQSYGGLLVRGYARRYPGDVAGMILIDAVHEDERITMGGKPQRIRDFATGRVRPEPRLAVDIALVRLRRSTSPATRDTTLLEPPLDRLPRGQQGIWRIASADSAYRLTWAAEMDWSPEELQRMHAERARDHVTLGDLPLVVISRAPGLPGDSLAAERAARQRDLVMLSHQATHVVATHAGHNIHIEEPRLVVRAIRGLIDRVRHPEILRGTKRQ